MAIPRNPKGIAYPRHVFMKLPKKKYKIIYADPPWSYADKGCQGTMANHYKGLYDA